MSDFTPGERIIGLAAFPDYDSELIEGDFVREDREGLVVQHHHGLSALRTIIPRTAKLVPSEPLNNFVDAMVPPSLAVKAFDNTGKGHVLSIDPNTNIPGTGLRRDLVYRSGNVLGVIRGIHGVNRAPAVPLGATRLAEVIVRPQSVNVLSTDVIVPTVKDPDEVRFPSDEEYVNVGTTDGGHPVFVTKSSGEQAAFANGGVRDTEAGKPRFDLLRPKNVPYADQMLTRFAALMARGAEKYSSRNWEQFSDDEAGERALSSAARHFEQWANGEVDEDHAVAVWFNIMAAEYIRGVQTGRWDALKPEESE